MKVSKLLLNVTLVISLLANNAGQGYALRPMAKALSDDVGIATGGNGLSVLISRLSDISPYRRARLRYIDSTKGIIDPQTMVSQLCEGIAKETLKDFGLNPDDYLFIISDSDELDTEFYTVNGENIIEITWGLLKFLGRHNIFNIDILRFILGHEVGHVLMTEERKKGKGKHTVINEEYRADGYGLKAVDKRGGSPMVALRYIEALREEKLEERINLTHPKLHRRQIKIFNEIRFKNWTNLSEESKPLSIDLPDSLRSKRYKFDTRLYGDFTFKNILASIELADSYHGLLRSMHLLTYSLKIQTVLNELKNEEEDLYVDTYPDRRNLKKKDLMDFYQNPQRDSVPYLILKYIQDSNIDPQEYLTDNDIDSIKGDFSSLDLDDEEFKVLLQSFLALKSDQNAYYVFRWGNTAYSLFSAYFYKEYEEDILKFWNDEKELFAPKKAEVEQLLKKRILELRPDLSEFSETDRELVIRYFFMGPLEYLSKEHTDNNDKQKERFEAISFQDPVKVLKIFLEHSYQYRNDYLEFTDKSWLAGLFHYDKHVLVQAEDYQSNRNEYIAFFDTLAVSQALEHLNKTPLDELMALYQIYIQNRDSDIFILDSLKHSMVDEEGFEQKLKKVILSKIKNFDQFHKFVKTTEIDTGWPPSLFKPLIRRMGKDDIIPFAELLMSKEQFRKYFYWYLEDICKQALKKGVQPNEMIKIIDRLMAEHEQEDYWQERSYEILGFMFATRIEGLIKGYAYLIKRLPDNEKKKELIAHYYKKFRHKFSVALQAHFILDRPVPKNLHIFDSHTSYVLVPILLGILQNEKLSPFQQMKHLIECGYLVNCKLIGRITNRAERKELFNLLKDTEIKKRFIENCIDEEDYREYVSFIAWSWFLDNPAMDKLPQGTRIKEISWLMPYLERSDANKYMFSRLAYRLDFKNIDDADAEVIRSMCKLCKADESSIPSSLTKHSEVRFNSFVGEKVYYKRQHRGEKDTYCPLYISMGRLPEDHYDKTNYYYLMLGDILLKRALRKKGRRLDDASWPIQGRIDLICQCFPHKTLYRNNLLFGLIGNPFTADPYQLDIIYKYLARDHVKYSIAKRIVLQKRNDKKLKLTTYQGVLDLINHYFPEYTPLREEIFHLLLQDVPITIPELKEYELKDPFETASEDIKKTAYQWITERIGDTLEDKPTKVKREFFEWLIGIRQKKPDLTIWYEYMFKRNLDDLPKVIASMPKVERYAFLSCLLVGALSKERIYHLSSATRGILNDKKEKGALIKNVFCSLTGKGKKEAGNDILYVIFDELFKACPEMKQLDILYALFEYCVENGAPNPSNRNEIIVRGLMAFGIVGVKLGQALSRYKLVKDEKLKKALLACNDDCDPLDKRFALNALLYDNDISEIEKVIESIDELSGSASVKQGYKITMKNRKTRALKYIKPLARYDVMGNLAVLKQVIAKLKDKIPVLKLLSGTLYREVEESVLKELEIEQEKENQRILDEFSHGMKGFGWELEIMKIDDSLKGKQFFMDVFFEGGIPLDEALKQELITERDFKNISSLITTMIMKQILILGRYHADLHYGNILIDFVNRRICIIDFGNCGRLSRRGRELFSQFILNLLFRRSARIKSIIMEMAEGNLEGLPQDASKAISKALRKYAGMPELCIQIKEILEHHDISFTGEFEFLFKFLESVRYLTDRVGIKGKAKVASIVYEFLKQDRTHKPAVNIDNRSKILTDDLRDKKEVMCGILAAS